MALVREARAHYKANAGNHSVLESAAPVLFFGDLPKYQESKPRIATAALNPSRKEFPRANPFLRFRDTRPKDDDNSYVESLVKYFQTCPYKSWFANYEQALLGMGASYYGGDGGVAIHTDIASVLPTHPTWSKLCSPTQEILSKRGVSLWRRLVELIRPDILLLSIAPQWTERLKFTAESDWQRLKLFKKKKNGELRKRPVELWARWYSLGEGTPMLVAWATASRMPLASLSHEQKQEVGRIVRDHWSRGPS